MRRIDEAILKGTGTAYVMSVQTLKRLAKVYGKMSATEVFEKERKKREQKVATKKAQA